jgi:non-homologous end joining protein Ku
MFYTIEHDLTPRTTVDHIYFDGSFFCSTKQGNGQKMCEVFNKRGVNSLETAISNLTYEERLRFISTTYATLSDCFRYCEVQKDCRLSNRPNV